MFKELIGFEICKEDTDSKMCAQLLLLCLSEYFGHKKGSSLVVMVQRRPLEKRQCAKKGHLSQDVTQEQVEFQRWKNALRMNACD